MLTDGSNTALLRCKRDGNGHYLESIISKYWEPGSYIETAAFCRVNPFQSQ